MIKAMGRLNLDDYKIMDAHVDKIFKNLDKGNTGIADKLIFELGNTANYFVREELGKRLATYTGKGKLDKICNEMLDNNLYGIRATALFYFYYKHQDNPEIIAKTLDKTFESVPWESETICFEMWKKAPEVMKDQMPHWADSDNPKKRAMSLHGMENIAGRNPQYVLTFVGRLIDDTDEEVQKKISHILTQVGRQRPLQTYASIRRWLLEGDENRAKTIWQTLKKLTSMFAQKNMRDKAQEFVSVSQRAAQEWRSDSNPALAQMGNRLAKMLKDI
jgi:hydrogenase maturation factor